MRHISDGLHSFTNGLAYIVIVRTQMQKKYTLTQIGAGKPYE